LPVVSVVSVASVVTVVSVVSVVSVASVASVVSVASVASVAHKGDFERAGAGSRPLPVKVGQIDSELPNRWLAPCCCRVS
jgi:hypothetical protein